MEERFSKRHGYAEVPDEVVYEDAPEALRQFLVKTTADHVGIDSAAVLRQVVCSTLRKRADPNNWSPGHILNEVEGLLFECEWFKVYDVIEALAPWIIQEDRSAYKGWRNDLNQLMVEEGVGWQIKNGKVVHRGTDVFEHAVSTADQALQEAGRSTS